jgi:NADPH2:quinone reductase
MRAIQIEEFRGPEAMRLVELPDPQPRDGEVVIEVARAGINFADTHVTRNDYLANQELPLIPGGEVAGRTPDGRRVAALLPSGGYAEKVAVNEGFLVPIPDEVPDDTAAALLLQGLTARSLVRTSARLAEGESIVIHAAAGGTGSLAVQLARRIGAGRVIALASSEEKRALARRLGADVAIDSRLPAARQRQQRRADANQSRGRGVLAGAPLPPTRGGARGDHGAARRGRKGRARGGNRRGIPALGRSPGARGHRRASHAREAVAGSRPVSTRVRGRTAR